jgi:hypothetical protein
MKKSSSDQSVEDVRRRMVDYSITFEISARPVLDYGEDQDLIHDIDGKIFHEEGMEKRARVGAIWAQKLDLGEALERRVSMYEVCDAESGELFEAYEAIFEKGSRVREDLELESFGDILIVHTITIDEKHRGRKLGLVALLQTIKTLGGGCSMVVIKPFPLQFSCKVTKKNEKQCLDAQEKLATYWRRLNFMRIPDTEYYYFDLTHLMPTAEELLGIGDEE